MVYPRLVVFGWRAFGESSGVPRNRTLLHRRLLLPGQPQIGCRRGARVLPEGVFRTRFYNPHSWWSSDIPICRFLSHLEKLSDTDGCRSSGRTQCLLRSIRHTDARGLIPSFRLAGPLSLAHRLLFFGAGCCSHAWMNTTLVFMSAW